MENQEDSDRNNEDTEMIELQRKTLFEIYEELSKMDVKNILVIDKTFFVNLKIRSTVFIRTLSSVDREVAEEMEKMFNMFLKTIASSPQYQLKMECQNEINELKKEWETLLTKHDDHEKTETKITDDVSNITIKETLVNHPSFTEIYFAVENTSTDELHIVAAKEELSEIWKTVDTNTLITDTPCLANLVKDSSSFHPMEIKKSNGYYQLKMIKDEEYWEEKKKECAEYYYILEKYLKNMAENEKQIPQNVLEDKEELKNLKEFLKTLPNLVLDSSKDREAWRQKREIRNYWKTLDRHILILEKCEGDQKMVLLPYSTFDDLVALGDLLHLLHKRGDKNKSNYYAGKKYFKCCQRLINEDGMPFKICYSSEIDEFVKPCSESTKMDDDLVRNVYQKFITEFEWKFQSNDRFSKLVNIYSAAYAIQENLLLLNDQESENFKKEVFTKNFQKEQKIRPIQENKEIIMQLNTKTQADSTGLMPVKYFVLKCERGKMDLRDIEIEKFMECELSNIQTIKWQFSQKRNKIECATITLPLEKCLSSAGRWHISRALDDLHAFLKEIKTTYDEVSHGNNMTLAITKPPSASDRLQFSIKSCD